MENPQVGAPAASSSEATEQSSACSGTGQGLGGGHKNFPFQKQTGESQGWGGASGSSSGREIAGFPELIETGRREPGGRWQHRMCKQNPRPGETAGDLGPSFPMSLSGSPLPALDLSFSICQASGLEQFFQTPGQPFHYEGWK